MIEIKKDSFLNISKEYEIKGAYVEIVNTCNLRCIHCYNESGNKKDILDINAFENIISSIPKDDPESSVTLSGGEPLLHPQIWDFIDILRESKIATRLMITNATLIDKDKAKRLVNSQMGVQISLNGTSAEIHDVLCGNGNFERTMRGLQFLLDEGYQENIPVRFTLTAHNKDNVIPFLMFMKSLGITHVDIAALSPVGRTSGHTDLLVLKQNEKEELLNFLTTSEEIKKLNDEGMHIGLPKGTFSGGCPILFGDEGKLRGLVPRIDPLGNVYLCQLFSDDLYSVGNVNCNTLQEIVESSDFSKLIWFLRFGIEYIHDCKKCVWQSICGKGCIAMVLQHGSVQETDGDCYFRKKGILEDFDKTKNTSLL